MGELDVEIKARVSSKTKERLAGIASQRGEGVKISTIVREAVGEYLARQRPENFQKLKLLPATNQAVVVTDPRGRVTYIDAQFTKMCGYTLDELRGKKPGEVLQGSATELKIVRDFRRAIRQRQPFECTITNYHASGEPYRVHIEMEPVFNASGALIEFRALEEKVA